MKLLELHHTEIKNIAWFPPNLMREWGEVKRYPEYFKTRTEWLDAARQGKVITIHPNVLMKITNFSEKGSFEKLSSEKRERVAKAFEEGSVEMPILFHKKDDTYELVAGNTRLVYAMDHDIPVKVLMLPEPKNVAENNKDKKDKK
jgi:hypothetical protein